MPYNKHSDIAKDFIKRFYKYIYNKHDFTCTCARFKV